jgi:hypothetical protein
MTLSTRDVQKDKRPEGTGKTEPDDGNDDTNKRQQKNGFATDMIGQAVPLEHSDSLCSKMCRHLQYVGLVSLPLSE